MRKAALVTIVLLLAASALLIIRQGTHQQCLLASLALIIIGVPLLLLSRYQLGKAFSVAPKATTLITRGLFSRIPHPMYVFLDLALLGVLIGMRLQWLVSVWLGIVAIQSWQSGREAKVLENAFGNEYRNYRRHTWW